MISNDINWNDVIKREARGDQEMGINRKYKLENNKFSQNGNRRIISCRRLKV